VAQAVIESPLEPRLDAIITALRGAAKRGEIRPGSITSLLARTGAALGLIHVRAWQSTGAIAV
jgi:hypothetical protein